MLPCQTEKSERRALAKELTKHLRVTLTELQSSSVEMAEPSRRTTISAVLHQSGLYGKGARPHGVCQKAPKDSQTMRNKILLSDEPKIEVFGLNAKRHIWRKPDGEAWWWKHHAVGMFFSIRKWETSQDRGKDQRSNEVQL